MFRRILALLLPLTLPLMALAVAQLTDGVTFHILAKYEGMYHICIPGEVSWAVAADGVYGYVAKEGILTGASPSALDALENAQ